MAQPRVITKGEMELCFDDAAATYDTIGVSPFAAWVKRLVALLALQGEVWVRDGLHVTAGVVYAICSTG